MRKWRNRIVGHDEVDPEQLLANPKNWRIHPKEQQQALEGVLAEVGWVQDVIVNERTGFVVDGHARVALAITAGEKVPVVYVDLSEDEERLILATLDPLSAMAVTDKELLGDLLKDLEVTNDAVKAMLAELEGNKIKPGLTDADDCPDAPIAPVTQLGDLWLLGGHRVLCGDSTDAGSVARLLGSAVPFLMVTDPPYGVGYNPEWRDDLEGRTPNRQTGLVSNDEIADWSSAYALFPGDVAYIWHAGIHAATVATGLTSVGFQIRSQIVWVKQNFVLSRGHYHWQHEPCWYAVREGNASHWHGDHKQATTWNISNLNPFGSNAGGENPISGHSTQKPVEIMRRPILNHTLTGESVYDPFLGSGTTLVAAEGAGRICYGLEIDPAYCDVIVQRWQDFTGKLATLEGHDGLTFDSVKAGRRMQAEDALKEEAVFSRGNK